MKIITPCHIIDLDILGKNLDRAKELTSKTNCKVLLSTKGMVTPTIIDYAESRLDGISIGSVYEARLFRNRYNKYIQIYSPAYIESQVDEICSSVNTIIFNSIDQFKKYAAIGKKHNCQIGIRINTLFPNNVSSSTNFCTDKSHLGIIIDQVDADIIKLSDGIHIHNMCESTADDLVKLIEFVDNRLGEFLNKLKWINLGGGEMLGSDSYDVDKAAQAINYIQDKYGIKVIIEPCEGIFVNSGTFKTTVLDILDNHDNKIAILDMSPVCHMPDAVFRGWKRDIAEGSIKNTKGYRYILSGQSCYTGDTLGNYIFDKPLKVGDTITFKDTATYNMVKTNMFNGIQMPNIYIKSKLGGYSLVRQSDYKDYLAII